MFKGMGKRISLQLLAMISVAAFAASAGLADEIPARTCTGMNCLPDQTKPADVCKGVDCNPPTPKEAEQCGGLDCQPIPEEVTPVPEDILPAPGDDGPAPPVDEKKAEPGQQ